MSRIDCFFLLICVMCLGGCEKKAPAMMSERQALAIAQKTPEARALFDYRGGALADCLESQVVRSCDSDYVTCRDDAWVVQFRLTDRCPVTSDGRLGLYLLVHGSNGSIISRYPEVDYFQDPQFCRDPADCVAVDGTPACVNFVEAPFRKFGDSSADCHCRSGRCAVHP